MKFRYWPLGLFAVIGSITGTFLGIGIETASAEIFAGIGTALGAGVGLGVSIGMQMNGTRAGRSCRVRTK